MGRRRHRLVPDNGGGSAPGADGAGACGIVGMQGRGQRAGGRLEVTSTPGTGTRVRVSLPLSAAAVSAAA